jgi:hypothetical protein
MTNGMGEIFSSTAISIEMGIRTTMVVTLSKNEEKKAVTTNSMSIIFFGSPLAFFATSTAIHSKIPVLFTTPTIIIIPINRNITFQSMKFEKASFWSTKPNNIIITPPVKATTILFIFSVAINT